MITQHAMIVQILAGIGLVYCVLSLVGFVIDEIIHLNDD